MLTFHAPAKINWFLTVLGRRPDGYHEVQTLMQQVSLYDALRFERSDRMEIICHGLDIAMKDNLVYKAALVLQKQSGIKTGAKITIDKQIPAAAGLGGGSSDAACALKGLNALWGLGIDNSRLAEISSSLGSDMPFFFYGPAAMAEGRGEIVKPVDASEAEFSIVLAKPKEGVSTAWAYSGIKRHGARIDVKAFIRALKNKDFGVINSISKNDLEQHVIERHPSIGEIKNNMLDHGALMSRMSGSGSSVFGVFEDIQTAERASAGLAPHWSVVVKTLAS